MKVACIDYINRRVKFQQNIKKTKFEICFSTFFLEILCHENSRQHRNAFPLFFNSAEEITCLRHVTFNPLLVTRSALDLIHLTRDFQQNQV